MESVLAYIGHPGLPEIMIVFMLAFIGLVVAAIKEFCFCRIFSKAGYSWAFGPPMLVPMAGLIIPLILALVDRPIRQGLRQLTRWQ